MKPSSLLLCSAASAFAAVSTLSAADVASLAQASTTGPVTSINGRTVQPWQLYYIASDGSGGTQVGTFGGGHVWAMKEFNNEQFIVGGEFTTYIDPNGNNTGANYLLFMDPNGMHENSLTW